MQNVKKYSLINVSQNHGNTVDGNWIQDITGTLEEAVQLAREIEKVNGNKISVAVVDQVNSTVPMLQFWTNLEKKG